MKTFLQWINEADTTFGAEGQTFYGDTASKTKEVAAGILPLAQNTKRICLLLRSKDVNNWIDGKSVDLSFGKGTQHLEDPVFKKMYMQGCYGTMGGALKGRSSIEAAKEETAEETGYTGPWLKMEKSLFWIIPGAGGKGYQNYFGLIPKEEALKYNPQAGSAWESQGIEWVDFENIKGKNAYNGIRFHDGLTALLGSAANQIVTMLEFDKTRIPNVKELPKPWHGEDVPPDSLASKRLGMFPIGANYK